MGIYNHKKNLKNIIFSATMACIFIPSTHCMQGISSFVFNIT